MRVLIISDIHGNFDALASLQETYDEMWVLGDLVNYGAEPGAVIDFVRAKASVVVCGNHDYSIGFNQDPRCSPRFREMAEVTRRYTNSVLSFGQKHFLRHLPPTLELKREDMARWEQFWCSSLAWHGDLLLGPRCCPPPDRRGRRRGDIHNSSLLVTPATYHLLRDRVIQGI